MDNKFCNTISNQDQVKYFPSIDLFHPPHQATKKKHYLSLTVDQK